jgi:predicted nuclease with RNAse H fold
MHVGIDYGARQAGTTVACFYLNGSWHLEQVEKKKDADQFLMKLAASLSPAKIYIDAPLSLPEVYRKNQFSPEDDFHYRACDRETGAMSPLFMGGLTARAIRLKTIWEQSGIAVMETYPAQLINILSLKLFYKKELEKFREEFSCIHRDLPSQFKNWHQVDAFLAWFSGYRCSLGHNKTYGNTNEGVTLV